jgi:hypothetical protein
MNLDELKAELARHEKALTNPKLFTLMGDKIQSKIDRLKKEISGLEAQKMISYDYNIDWNATRKGQIISFNGAKNHFNFEMFEFFELNYSIGYFINIRHTHNHQGHYVAAIRDGKLLFEDEGAKSLETNRPEIVSKIFKKNPNRFPLTFKDAIASAYQISWAT